jgi:hypothetical protein
LVPHQESLRPQLPHFPLFLLYQHPSSSCLPFYLCYSYVGHKEGAQSYAALN